MRVKNSQKLPGELDTRNAVGKATFPIVLQLYCGKRRECANIHLGEIGHFVLKSLDILLRRPLKEAFKIDQNRNQIA